MSNKFDIKKNKEPKRYSPDDIKKLLEGYVEVQRADWKTIPVGTHMRYYKTNGTFVRGGFVTSHWFNADKKPFIHLANNINKRAPGYATWPVAYEATSRIFMKPGAVKEEENENAKNIGKLLDILKRHDRDIKILQKKANII